MKSILAAITATLVLASCSNPFKDAAKETPAPASGTGTSVERPDPVVGTGGTEPAGFSTGTVGTGASSRIPTPPAASSSGAEIDDADVKAALDEIDRLFDDIGNESSRK